VTPDATSRPVLIMIRRAVAAAAPSGPRFERLDPRSPQIGVLDLGITRGDGIFESIGVIGGVALELEPHLARLGRSAAMLDLPQLDIDTIRAAVHAAIDAHEPAPELLVKVFVTRGPEGNSTEGSGTPTAWVHAAEGPDYAAERTHGIRAVTLDRGYRRDVAVTSPWLLQGAKTLSYAVNRAALREAGRRGADDVVFLSSDGFALEGPASSLIIRNGARFRTPRLDSGVLAGTTQATVFRMLEGEGQTTEYSHITDSDLRRAANIWLASSGRLIVPVRALDGVEVPVDREMTARMLRGVAGVPFALPVGLERH
jgi:4-amino-4-deoxychorismate lyase